MNTGHVANYAQVRLKPTPLGPQCSVLGTKDHTEQVKMQDKRIYVRVKFWSICNEGWHIGGAGED